jgi:glutathione S-transferase
VKLKLYGIPGSHNVAVGEAMIRHKGIDYQRRDLVPGAHLLLVRRVLGFSGGTVPAVRAGDRRFHGTREISRGLEELRPDPPLFPANAEARRAVEDAERWGEDVMQPISRHLFWGAAKRDLGGMASYLDDAKLGFPTALVKPKPSIAPVVLLVAKIDGATDEAVRTDLTRVRGALEHADELIDADVIGGAEPTAADFQIGGQVRALLGLADLRPVVERYQIAELARRLLPDYKGSLKRVFSEDELVGLG